MVCVACLLPLFLVPIINLLPLLFDLVMAKVYGMLGWEYMKPVRTPPACPYNPAANKSQRKEGAIESEQPEHAPTPLPAQDNCKVD